MDKAEGAFLTIGELAQELGVAQHILRYWETRFPQLRPLQRSGNRRYYRPADVEVARHIHQLLNEQGFTVRGARRVLDNPAPVEAAPSLPADPVVQAAPEPRPQPNTPEGAQPRLALGDAPAPRRGRGQFDSSDIALLIARLTVIRENLKDAIEAN